MAKTCLSVFYCVVVALAVLSPTESARAAPPQEKPETHEVAGDHAWADRVNLDDLVPYTLTPAAWSDRNSDIAIAWTKPEEFSLTSSLPPHVLQDV